MAEPHVEQPTKSCPDKHGFPAPISPFPLGLPTGSSYRLLTSSVDGLLLLVWGLPAIQFAFLSLLVLSGSFHLIHSKLNFERGI